jgi:hypothetical protein
MPFEAKSQEADDSFSQSQRGRNAFFKIYIFSQRKARL